MTGLRIGLLLDAGAVCRSSRRYRRRSTARAGSTPAGGMSKRQAAVPRHMLDGWTCSGVPGAGPRYRCCRRNAGGQGAALHRRLGRTAAGAAGIEVYQGFNQIMGCRALATQPAGLRLWLGADRADAGLRCRAALPDQRPCPAVRAHRLYRRFNIAGAARCLDKLRLHQQGLPIGLQIVGKRFDDLGVLRAAYAFEQMREPQLPWPQAKKGQGSALDPLGP